MSKLRQSFLESIRIIGNHSGCHQIPERSFFYKGKQFPVCARCTGVFLGQLLAVILAILKKDIKKFSLIAILISIMGIDWGIQEVNIKESTNTRRFITGICGGLGVFSFYIYTAKKMISRAKQKRG